MKKQLAIITCLSVMLFVAAFSLIYLCNDHDEYISNYSDEEMEQILDDRDILSDSEYELLAYEYDDGSGVYKHAYEFPSGSETLKFEYPGMYTYTYREYVATDSWIDIENYETVTEYGSYTIFGNSLKLMKWESRNNPGEIDIDAFTDPNSYWAVEGNRIIHTVEDTNDSSRVRAIYTKKETTVST